MLALVAIALVAALLFLSADPETPEVPARPSGTAPVSAPAATPSGSARDRAHAPTSEAEMRRRWLERAIAEAREERMRRAEGARGEEPSAEKQPRPSPLARTGGPAPAAADDEAVGHLEPDYIRARIEELKPLLAECYELGLHTDPSLEGRLTVEFVISAEPDVGGIVEESRIDDGASTLVHPVVYECVRETMYTAEFTAPEGGGRVTVRYPFVFRREAPEQAPTAPPGEGAPIGR